MFRFNYDLIKFDSLTFNIFFFYLTSIRCLFFFKFNKVEPYYTIPRELIFTDIYSRNFNKHLFFNLDFLNINILKRRHNCLKYYGRHVFKSY